MYGTKGNPLHTQLDTATSTTQTSDYENLKKGKGDKETRGGEEYAQVKKHPKRPPRFKKVDSHGYMEMEGAQATPGKQDTQDETIYEPYEPRYAQPRQQQQLQDSEQPVQTTDHAVQTLHTRAQQRADKLIQNMHNNLDKLSQQIASDPTILKPVKKAYQLQEKTQEPNAHKKHVTFQISTDTANTPHIRGVQETFECYVRMYSLHKLLNATFKQPINATPTEMEIGNHIADNALYVVSCDILDTALATPIIKALAESSHRTHKGAQYTFDGKARQLYRVGIGKVIQNLMSNFDRNLKSDFVVSRAEVQDTISSNIQACDPGYEDNKLLSKIAKYVTEYINQNLIEIIDTTYQLTADYIKHEMKIDHDLLALYQPYDTITKQLHKQAMHAVRKSAQETIKQQKKLK